MTGGSVLRTDLLTRRQLQLVLAITFAGMFGSVLAPALPGIADALGVSDSDIGLLVTAFKAPSIVAVPLAAWLADTYGRRPVVAPSLGLFGAAGVAMYAVSEFATLLALAVIAGTGAAAVLPLTVTLLGDHFSGAESAAAQGLRVAVVGAGALSIPAATGYLSNVSWNYPFLLFGGVLPIALAAYLFLEETAADRRRDGGLQSELGRYGQAMRTELTERTISVLVVGGFIRGFVRYALLTFVPLFAVRALDATLFEAGLLLSIRGLAYLVFAPLAASIVVAVGRTDAMAAAMCLSALCLALVPASPNVPALGALVFLYTVGDAVFDPVMKDTVTTAATPEFRAGVVNTHYVLKRAGQTASPAAFGGVLALTGFQSLFVLAGLIAAAYVVLLETTVTFDPVAHADEI